MSETARRPPVEGPFDAILIGSGIGALATASILARVRNARVLVLERHFKAGGFTHAFKREGKFHWDVGVHYIGGLAPGAMLREIFDLVTDGGVQWNPMPDPFEKFVYPDFTFDVPNDEREYERRLIAQFPAEEQAIKHYFHDVKSVAGWFGRHVSMKALPSALEKVAHLLNLLGEGEALMTTREYMERNFRDPKLRALLVSQWGDYGLPPSDSAFVIQAMIAAHYFGGGYYPVGGAGVIAASVEKILQQHGGAILLNHQVEEILVEQGRAVGVRVKEIIGQRVTEKTIYAPVVFSDAGAWNTYFKLLPAALAPPFREELAAMRNGVSCVTLYLGFKDDPRKLGFRGENYWIYDGYDHDAIYAARNELLNGKVGAAYLSFPSLKDPGAHAPTGEIITFCDYDLFAKWKDAPWKNRGADYDELKARIAEALLAKVERHFPGFRDLVAYSELSTPLTNEHFTDHPGGSIYGLACTPDRFRKEWLGVKTPIEGLYLTGADASSPGVAGALMGGVMAAATHLGLGGVMKLFKELKRAG